MSHGVDDDSILERLVINRVEEAFDERTTEVFKNGGMRLGISLNREKGRVNLSDKVVA